MLDNSSCPIASNRIIITSKPIDNVETVPTKLDINFKTKVIYNSINSRIQGLCVMTNKDSNMAIENHSDTSINNNDQYMDNSHILQDDTYDSIIDVARRWPPTIAEIERYKSPKKEDKHGRQSIVRKRVKIIYSGREAVPSLNFKCDRNTQKWKEALGTMAARVRAVFGLAILLLAMLGTCAATPVDSRPTRSIHLEKATRSYLEQFGYLKNNRPEVGNLQTWTANQVQEDDFKIAIKSLQEFAGIAVTGEIDEATLKLMKKRRCGRPDIETENENLHRRKRFAIQGEKWRHTNLTWSLSSTARSTELDPHGTREVLARALDVWAQQSRLTFQEINSDEADIVVSFVRGYHNDAYPFDGRGNILAHAFFPGTGRGGDAHFDDDELWLLQPKSDEEDGTSLLAVAAHEFGHSLGLSHSSVVGALMYPYYQGIQPNFVLPEDDRNGIQQLYGPREKRTWGRIPNYRPIVPPTTTTTTTTTTKRPYHYHTRHPERHPDRRPSYNPYNPRPNYPTYYPYRPTEKPYYPDRRYYNTSEEHPRRPNHQPYPPETTTHPSTQRPRYPQSRPEYPNYPKSNYPTHPKQNNPKDDYPKKKPYYYPVKTTTVKTPVRPSQPSDKPNTCDTSYDAVALIRGELFIFKGKYHWRIGSNGRYSNYPMEIIRMWPELPNDLTHVDAVYERPDRNIAFFIGKQLYLFDSVTLKSGYPKPLEDLGLPRSLQKLDAAMVWGHNDKTYFYSGTMYWKYDEDIGRVEPDYPRDMVMWRGVGYNIDSVFQWKDGKTYFFKGKGFWKFNDLRMTVEHEKQLPSAPFWMNCPSDRSRRPPYPPAPESTIRSPSSSSSAKVINLTPFLSSIVFVLFNYFRYC